MAANWSDMIVQEVMGDALDLVEQATRAVAVYVEKEDVEGYHAELQQLTASVNDIPAEKLPAVLCAVLGYLIWPEATDV